MDLPGTIALTMGVAWASGINLYAAVGMLGILGATGNVDLPPGLDVLAHPLVIAAACVMYVVEFFADKVPGLDTGWDAIHTFIRIPAGAVLAAQAVGPVSEPVMIAAGLLGGALAAGSHATKAGTRAAINTSPEPFTNIAASITEDVAVFGGLWAALHHPGVFFGVFLAFVLFAAWALPKIWRGLKRLVAFVRRKLGGATERQTAEPVVTT